MLSRLTRAIRNPSDFIRSLMVLVTGTVIAQLIMLIALPLLTRLYGPEDFSALAVYASLLGILSVAACLGLDMAVSMPESDEESIGLLILAIFFAAVTSLTVGLALYFFNASFLIRIGLEKLLPFLWIIPVGIFIGAVCSAVQFYAVRKKSFSEIAKAKIGQSSVAISSQVGLGLYGLTPFGLLFGHMLSGGIGFLYLSSRLISKENLFAISFGSLKTVLAKYKKFPQFTTFETLTNSAGIQVPIILIATIIAGPEAGFLFLAMRVMQAPMSLIGGAISQVYLANAPQENLKKNLGPFTENIISGLVKVGVGPIIFAGVTAPLIFSIIFGADWERSG
ncbi:MAG: polysaccharide biosynthesis protein, partial [Pedobacter sp.]